MLYNKDGAGRLEHCKEEWPKAYYEETNPLVRKEMLDIIEADAAVVDEALSIRKELWELRYASAGKKPGEIDCFIRGLVYLKSVYVQMDSLFGKRRCKKMLDDAKKDLVLDRYEAQSELYREVLRKEWENLAGYYFTICVEDRNFSTGALGLFKLKDEEIRSKVAEEVLTTMVRVPGAMNQKEDFGVISEIFMNTFSETFYQGRTVLEEKLARMQKADRN